MLAHAYTQLGSLARVPRRVAEIADRLETGTFRVGVVPTGLEDIEHVLRSVANRIGAALIVVGLLLASALMAQVSDWIAVVGFVAASILGLYMVLEDHPDAGRAVGASATAVSSRQRKVS